MARGFACLLFAPHAIALLAALAARAMAMAAFNQAAVQQHSNSVLSQ
jgi:hypothetical protein